MRRRGLTTPSTQLCAMQLPPELGEIVWEHVRRSVRPRLKARQWRGVHDELRRKVRARAKRAVTAWLFDGVVLSTTVLGVGVDVDLQGSHPALLAHLADMHGLVAPEFQESV